MNEHDAQVAVIQTFIDSLQPERRARVEKLAVAFETIIETLGDDGALAIALVGAKIAAK